MSTLYDMMSGVPARTGGEFKLLYGNREKIGKASGLAIWVFDDTAIKLENLVFTETLEEKQSGYEQSIDPMAGGEFKLLYGNREKIKLASEKGEFVFGEIADRPTINGLSVVESVAGNCDYQIGTLGCEAEGTYIIESVGDNSKFTYLWSCEDAEITSDPTMNFVRVKTGQSNISQVFDLTCMVIDNMVAQAEVVETITQARFGHVQVSIDSFDENSNISCVYEFPSQYKCEARTTHAITTSSSFGVDIVWNVSGGAYIVSGQGTDTVVIGTSSRTDVESFMLGVTISDEVTSAFEEQNIVHTRIGRADTNIVSLTEISNVGCVYDSAPGSECTATSRYHVVYDDNGLANTIVWTVSGEAIIVEGQGTDTLKVTTTGNEDLIDFNVTVVVSDAYTQDTVVLAATHAKEARVPIDIVSINEVSAGSCLIGEGSSTCVAQNQFVVTAGVVDYETATVLWEVDGNATIVSDPTTIPVTISTDTGSDELFNLTITVDDGYTSDSLTTQFNHKRDDDIVIADISEDVAGACIYVAGGTCVATSTHTVDVYGADTYVWTIAGNATIISGAGTATVMVESTEDDDVQFTLECTCSNVLDSEVMDKQFMHTHSEEVLEEFSSSVVYDETNIATEFIA